MVLRKEIFLKYFLEIVTTEVVKEFGKPPFPMYIAKWLLKNFLKPPMEPEPVSAESASAMAPEPEPGSTVKIIEWDDPMQPIGFHHSASEQPEVHATSLATLIHPLAPFQQIVMRPAPTMVNEVCPAPTL